MPSRLQMSALTLLISGIWVVLLILDGTLVQITWLRHISTVSGMAVLALASFDLWIWRLPLLRGWFVQRPNIRGTWKVRIESHWIDPRTGTRIGAIEGYARIRQTYSTLRLRLMTRESSSDLLGSEMIREADGGF